MSDMKAQLNCVDSRLAEVDSRTRKLEEYHAKAQELGAFKEIVELKLIIIEKDVKELKEKVKLA